MTIQIPISIGELLDKITILQIKRRHSDNPYITKELECLESIAYDHDVYNDCFLESLYEVNQKLWIIEDDIRECEKNNSFDLEFISLARSVYITNDKRAKIKRDINEYYNSEFCEVKLHSSDFALNAKSRPAAPNN